MPVREHSRVQRAHPAETGSAQRALAPRREGRWRFARLQTGSAEDRIARNQRPPVEAGVGSCFPCSCSRCSLRKQAIFHRPRPEAAPPLTGRRLSRARRASSSWAASRRPTRRRPPTPRYPPRQIRLRSTPRRRRRPIRLRPTPPRPRRPIRLRPAPRCRRQRSFCRLLRPQPRRRRQYRRSRLRPSAPRRPRQQLHPIGLWATEASAVT